MTNRVLEEELISAETEQMEVYQRYTQVQQELKQMKNDLNQINQYVSKLRSSQNKVRAAINELRDKCEVDDSHSVAVFVSIYIEAVILFPGANVIM